MHLETLWSQNISITTRLVDAATTPLLLKTVQSGRIDPKNLITHRFNLSQIADAYETFGNASRTKALKVIIETDFAQPLQTGSATELETKGSSPADVWSCNLLTRGGLVLHVRPVRPEDDVRLAEFFAHLTPQDLRFRFLGGVREVSRERLLSMTQVDHSSTENFLAFSDDSEAIIASAMVACDTTTQRAEVAISVRAEYKHMGVAWEMLRHAARFAEASGAKSLESLESRANHEAIELEREQGFVAVPYADDPTLVLIRKDLRQG